MAANTFLEITRSLRLYVPQLPLPLAEQFIRDRYRRILERRDWSALRREAEFLLNDQKTAGTVAVTRGSTTVTGTGTSFTVPDENDSTVISDVGRQFKIGSGAIYTIEEVNSTTDFILDRPYAGTTASGQTYRIFDGYVTPPTDFLRFVIVSDPSQGWRLRHWITSDELMALDPQRNTFGQPYLLADQTFNSAGTLPRFEAWPYTASARAIYYMYIMRGADLEAEGDTPIWPLRSDVIVKGALADVARWPGTAEKPNPYFARPEYWKSYELDFEDSMIELERRDEEIYMTMLKPHADLPLAPLSASFIQSHAI